MAKQQLAVRENYQESLTGNRHDCLQMMSKRVVMERLDYRTATLYHISLSKQVAPTTIRLSYNWYQQQHFLLSLAPEVKGKEEEEKSSQVTDSCVIETMPGSFKSPTVISSNDEATPSLRGQLLHGIFRPPGADVWFDLLTNWLTNTEPHPYIANTNKAMIAETFVTKQSIIRVSEGHRRIKLPDYVWFSQHLVLLKA
ncbi:hypothetical protein BDB00DRAFT_792571 [Zychaea mexicana]|uniref:uncharacterized protein n=1 Tax=Zychaea mexicana TaxID=64656 RepID=UPI0022FE9BB6|nr:uncharacterized protein BDB00DRAFT_792571 [Zychaea mexicana]KAI9484847.1 hypothetical protein BDB00DRAFT_792571 [Zychaea mexicana]